MKPQNPINTVREVATVAGLVSAVTNASAGETIKIRPGTYTLTESLVIPSGVTFQGSGVGQTILTGTFAGSLILGDNSSVGTYDIGAIAAFGLTGTTDTAAEAGNITKGDILYIDDGGTDEKFVVEATTDGVAGTGVFAFGVNLPLSVAATSTVEVFNSMNENITIKDLTLLGDDTNTTHGINMTANKNVVIDNVVVKDVTLYGLILNKAVDCKVKMKVENAALGTFSTMGTNCDIDVTCYNCDSGTFSGVVNEFHWSNLNFKYYGGTPSDSTSVFNRCHRNMINLKVSTTSSVRSVNLSTSDENIVNVTSQQAVLDGGTGNQVTST